MPDALIAGIEAGGTKMLCALAREDGELLAQARIATTAPVQTFAAVGDFFARATDEHGRPVAAGIASFGPLDLDRRSNRYGSLTTTPKLGWSGTNMVTCIEQLLDAPVAIDTDVNCAAVGEACRGAGRGVERLCYVTVGTGIGVGILERGRPMGALGHSEAGHIRVPRAPGDEAFTGNCPFHGDCLEGLASGPAMAARWRAAAETLDADHVAWQFEEYYLAALCINLTYSLRPERIIIGGGVMENPLLLARVRTRYEALAGGYALDRCSADPETYICAPACRDPSPGLLGAFELARNLLVTRDGR